MTWLPLDTLVTFLDKKLKGILREIEHHETIDPENFPLDQRQLYQKTCKRLEDDYEVYSSLLFYISKGDLMQKLNICQGCERKGLTICPVCTLADELRELGIVTDTRPMEGRE
jgi:hypothetical protein